MVEEKSVAGCPLPALASMEYRPVPIERLGTVKVRTAFPPVSDVTLFSVSMTVLPHIQRKLTDVPAG